MKAKILNSQPSLDVNRISFIANRKVLNFKTIVDCRSTIVNKKGYTLIELLVVMSIIAILVGSGVASWQNAQMKARDGKRKGDIRAVQQGLEIYLQRNGKYPSADASGQIKCNVDGDALVREWGNPFVCGGMLYMQQLPPDPVFVNSAGGLASYIPRQYNYQNPKNSTYVLSANLENINDVELATLVCVPQIGYNYCVTNP